MGTGNITHEQIKIEDAKKTCVKVGNIVGRDSCNWTLDVVIDGEVYTGLEICYHCQNEQKFTPEKAFDVFDYGRSVFVLCIPREDGSVERKVIGLLPDEDKAYPKLCGLKRFFAKVQQIGADGYPLWDSIDPMNPTPICKYYWVYFNKDGSVVAEEVRNHSFIDPDEAFNVMIDEATSLYRQFADGFLSLEELAGAFRDFIDQHANATEILDHVTAVPEGSDSIFSKSFMLNVGECKQRYVAEQHLLMKDRRIKFDFINDFPVTHCTYVQYSPPNRFYCNVSTGDMVWSHIIQEDCPIFLGVTLHVNLEDGSIGEYHSFDLNGYVDYFNPPSSEAENIDGLHEVHIGTQNHSDLPFDLIPEITNIEGNVISGYRFYLGRPMKFTFDVMTAESHWEGGKDSQAAEHVLWAENEFIKVPSWHFEQEINSKEKKEYSHYYFDNGEYGPYNYDDACGDSDFFMRILCVSCEDVEGECEAKCHHCASIKREYGDSWNQKDNGRSYVSFDALDVKGEEENLWNTIEDEDVWHKVTFYACKGTELDCWFDCEATPNFGGNRVARRDYKYRESSSYAMAWVSPNCVYVNKKISREYHDRYLGFSSNHISAHPVDWYGNYHCGGPEVEDFNRWTDLSSSCLRCVAGTPDFNVPFLDFPGWPSWPDGYTQDISYSQGEGWNLNRGVYINDFQDPYVRAFHMEGGIVFSADTYEIPYFLDDRTSNPSAGLIIAAKGYQDYINAAGSSHWKIYHDGIDVAKEVLDALKCDPAVLVTIGMV